MRHRDRRGQWLESAIFAAGEEAAESVVDDDVSELQPGVLDVDPRNGPDEVDDRPFSSTFEEEQGPFHLGPTQRVPAASDTDERLFGSRQLRACPR